MEIERDELPFGEWFNSTSFVCCINKVNIKSAVPSVPLLTSISSSPKRYNKKLYKMQLSENLNNFYLLQHVSNVGRLPFESSFPTITADEPKSVASRS